MKFPASPRFLFFLGFILLAATNIVVLAGVYSNRSQPPDALGMLTERELKIPYRLHRENSGLALRIDWRLADKENRLYNRKADWLDAAKLKELGFSINTSSTARVKHSHRYFLSKEVFIVLEYNGPSYRDAVHKAKEKLAKKEALYKNNSGAKKLREDFKRAEKDLNKERVSNSRLFAIDAGTDPHRLREKYRDRSRFIVTRAIVRPSWGYGKKADEIGGYISNLSIRSLTVPLNQRRVFDTLMHQHKSTRKSSQAPRYTVKVAYGSRLEPWIVSVEPIK